MKMNLDHINNKGGEIMPSSEEIETAEKLITEVMEKEEKERRELEERLLNLEKALNELKKEYKDGYPTREEMKKFFIKELQESMLNRKFNR